MKIVSGGVTSPGGFLANGLSCGIKRSGKPDLALIVSAHPAIGAAVFTKNSVKAAPLLVSQQHLRQGRVQAVLINSGNANCFTGRFGFMYARQTTELVANRLKIPANQVLVSSTGIIGRPLPFEKIKAKTQALVDGLSSDGGTRAARAILTTDRRTKEAAVEFSLAGRKATIGACAKGAGMVAPNMATMLGFITTDVFIRRTLLKKALVDAVNHTFNSITIDGCMSTNDMVVVMANGLAGNKRIVSAGKNYAKFAEALCVICNDLAQKIISDAEGATKFVTIAVEGANTGEQARSMGLAVANSVLVKTALYGSNPNWGRVAAAVGSLGIPQVKEGRLKMHFSPFNRKHITITIDLNMGNKKATIYTCDLSQEYVRINAEYN